jgi:prepilin-type N-terminal cleavage/methylation domain-containing protein
MRAERSAELIPRVARNLTDSRNEFRAPARAFTLIEIMVVVAIMGIILAAGIPSLYGFFHKEGIRKTMSDIADTCRSVRAKAIMTGEPAELVIHPRAGTMEVGGGGDGGGYGSWAHSAKIQGAKLEALRINNGDTDLSDFEEVRVRFYPDGKCEEMTMILRTDKGENRGVSLEITTSLPILLTDGDIREWRSRLR